MATLVKGDKIKDGSIPLSALSSEIKNKLGDDKYKKLDWYYSDNWGACVAESQTNKIIINEETYDLTDEPVSITVNGKEYGFMYSDAMEGPRVIAFASHDSEIDILTNNVFILNEVPSTATPNWNAQEGEAGYIKNRTHSAKIINPIVASDNLIEYNWITDYNKLHMIYPSNIGGYKTLYLPHGEPMTISGNEFFEVDKYSIDIEWDGDSSIRLVFVEGGANNFAQYFTQNLTVGEYVQLSGVYIPDTVLKTTPQTLSDSDKNQALANLGIDPVVWKYMCNPHEIIYDVESGDLNNATIPQELHDIIWDDTNECLRNIVCKVLIFKAFTVDDITNESIVLISNQTHVITAKENAF